MRPSRPLFALLACASLGGCAFQTVRITSEPPQADIFVDGTLKGQEPVFAKLSVDSFMNILGKEHQIVAKKAGYHDQLLSLNSDSFMFSDSHPFPDVVTLKLQPTATNVAPPAAAPEASAPPPSSGSGSSAWWKK